MGDLKNGLKQLELNKENMNIVSMEEQKVDKEIEVLRERKISMEKQKKSSNPHNSISKGKKNVHLQKLCHYLSPCQIIAEVRNEQEVINSKITEMKERKIGKESKHKLRSKLLSIPTR